MEHEVVTISGSSEPDDSTSPKKESPKRKRRVHSLQIRMTMEESTSNSESNDETSSAPPVKKLRKKISVSYCDQDAEIVDDVSCPDDEVLSDDESPAMRKPKKKKASDSDDEYVPEERPAAKRRKLTVEGEEKVKPPTKVRAARKTVAKKVKVVVKKEKIAKPKTERKPRLPRKPKSAAAPSDSVDQDGVKIEASTSKDVKVKPETYAKMDWDEAEYLAELQRIEFWVAANVKKLFDEDNTIPFIARYRKEMTEDMSPEKLRLVKESYEMIKLDLQKCS